MPAVLKLYYSPEHDDNYTLATPAGEQAALDAGYQLVRTEAYGAPEQTADTKELKLFWSERLGDNFTTATPEGEQSALDAGYQFIRVEAYVYTGEGPGTVALDQYWSDARKDNFLAASEAGKEAALADGYRFVRTEGYVSLAPPVDVSKINDQLWCGGAITTEADVATIASYGITADIDCREEFNDHSLIEGYDNLPPTPGALKEQDQIAYYYAGVPDDGEPKPVSWFSGAWDFAKPLLEGGGVVLAHCAAGVNRGPSMAYFLLRAYWGTSAGDAYALIKEQRPVARIGYQGDADNAIQALGLSDAAPSG